MADEVRELCTKMILDIARIHNHPAFLGILKEIGAAPEGPRRIETLMRLMTHQEMVRRGVPIPESADVKIDVSSVTAIDNLGEPLPPVRFSFDVCVGFGADFVSIGKCWTVTVDISAA